MEQAAADLLIQADSPLQPTPLADRLRTKAEELRRLAAHHRAERVTRQDQEEPKLP